MWASVRVCGVRTEASVHPGRRALGLADEDGDGGVGGLHGRVGALEERAVMAVSFFFFFPFRCVASLSLSVLLLMLLPFVSSLLFITPSLLLSGSSLLYPPCYPLAF